MLRVKEEESNNAKDRDYYSRDSQLSDDFSETEMELYKHYRAGEYDEHNPVSTSTPHKHFGTVTQCISVEL